MAVEEEEAVAVGVVWDEEVVEEGVLEVEPGAEEERLGVVVVVVVVEDSMVLQQEEEERVEAMEAESDLEHR